MHTCTAVYLVVTLVCIGSMTSLVNAGDQQLHEVGIVTEVVNVTALDGHDWISSDMKRELRCPCGVCRTPNGYICCRCDCECLQGWCPHSNSLVCPPCVCNCNCFTCSGSGHTSCCPRCDCECGFVINTFAALASVSGVGGVADCKPCGGCFPSVATVKLENGKTLEMSELQKGDRVETVTQDGRITHSQIRTFLNTQQTVIYQYKTITTSLNNTIRLTGTHLIYGRKSGTSQFQTIYADQLSVGDEVLANENDYLAYVKVMNVSSIKMQGAYLPVTLEGNIVVDGVSASCYAFADHDLAHFATAPMRWYPEIIEWIFGTENGLPGYANLADAIGRSVVPKRVIFN